MNKIDMLEELKLTIYSKEWRCKTLEKLQQYKEVSTNIKLLKRLEKLIKRCELARARKIINQELLYEKGLENRIVNAIKNIFKCIIYFLKSWLIDSFKESVAIVEPNYQLSSDEIEELIYRLKYDNIGGKNHERTIK